MQPKSITRTLALGGFLLSAPLFAQTQEAKLVANSGKDGDRLGESVALSGDVAALGAPDDRANSIRSGSVFVFEKLGGAWAQVQRLNSSNADTNDDFGAAVGLDADFMVVGAPQVDLGGGGGGFGMPARDWGAAYVFERSGGLFNQTQILIASDNDPFDFFGGAVAISGDTAVIGAVGANKGAVESTGAAYVYVRGGGGTWTQQAKLTASDAQAGDNFGVSVAIDGDRIAIGAQNGDGLATDSGSVYVFERSGTVWSEVTELMAADGASGDRMGSTVALSGDNVLAGARTILGGLGAVYAFRDNGGWAQDAKLLASDGLAGDLFGSSVALDGDEALIGATNVDTGGFDRSGAAYTFSRSSGSWVELAKLAANDPSDLDGFGNAAAIDGTGYLVGAVRGDGNQDNAGAGYVFRASGDVGTQYCFCDTGVCSNPDPTAGCANQTGVGALLGGTGSASVSADDLVLTAVNIQPNQFGLMFMAPGQASVPFGDGLRCVAAAGVEIYRFPIRNTGAAGELIESGVVGTSQGFNANGQIAAGQTWNFQSWYRDPGGPCGTAFNTSNGLEVTFLP